MSTNQLTSPLLTTEIDNYRDLLIDDDKRRKSLNLANSRERELFFQMKQNEILTRKKLNLQGKNEHLNGDVFYLEGQIQILKQENDYLRKKLMSFEKKSMDEMKIYQDRSLQLAENVNQIKWELEDMKNINDKNLKTFISTNQIKHNDILSMLRSQEIQIAALSSNIFNKVTPANQEIINKIAFLNKAMLDLIYS